LTLALRLHSCQFNDTTISTIAVSKDWARFSFVVHNLAGVVGIQLSGIAYFDDFNVTMLETSHSGPPSVKSDDDSLLVAADPPVNFVVDDVVPRRCPVGGVGADGKVTMLTLVGTNFSSIPRDNNGSSTAYCWIAESWCGWHFTLVHNFISTNATIVNDTHVQCPCPAYDFGGRVAVSLKTQQVTAAASAGRRSPAAAPSLTSVPRPMTRSGIPEPEPKGWGSSPAYGSYDIDDASCTLSPAAGDALSFRVQGGPFQTQASASIDYFPLLSISSRYYPFTTASDGEILVRLAPELSVASELQVTIDLLAADGWYTHGSNATLATAVDVAAGHTSTVGFDLTKMPARTLGNITAILSGIVPGNPERIVLAHSSNRFLFAGPPMPSQIILDHGTGTLLGDGNVRLSGSGWYQGWVQWGPARMRLVANADAFGGATATMATGLPGFVGIPGATTNNGRTVLNQTLVDMMERANLEHVNETLAFIRHCRSLGVWVIADIPATWVSQWTFVFAAFPRFSPCFT
jgi:hypothetical protein